MPGIRQHAHLVPGGLGSLHRPVSLDSELGRTCIPIGKAILDLGGEQIKEAQRSSKKHITTDPERYPFSYVGFSIQ